MASRTFKAALKEVRPLIAGGRFRYICEALAYIDNDQFKGRIQALLGEYATYRTWLIHVHGEKYREISRPDERDGRLQWIDHMIAQEP